MNTPSWRHLYHRFKALNLPFRRRWFKGYDLDENTYWEFIAQGKLRRLVEFKEKADTIGEYSQRRISPFWSSWLRFTRDAPPTMQELMEEEQRKLRIKQLAWIADQKWKSGGKQAEDPVTQTLRSQTERIQVHDV